MKSKSLFGIIIILAGSLTISCETSPSQAHISAYIKGLSDSIVRINYFDVTGEKTDTVKVSDGKFTWTKDIEPQQITIPLDSVVFSFFVENNKITVNGDVRMPDSVIVKGSSIQDEANKFRKNVDTLVTQKMAALYTGMEMNNTDPATAAAVEQQMETLIAKEDQLTEEYITAHPKSHYSAYLVNKMAMFGSYSNINRMYNKLDTSLRRSNIGKRTADRLEILKRSEPGTKVLDFTLQDVNDNPVSINSFAGKYVFIDFWASWCGPCRAENPNVLKAYNKFKDKNFTVLGISLDQRKEDWKKAIVEDNLPWQQVSDLKGFENSVSSYYGIQGIPSTLLVDPEGRIIAKDLRGEALHAKLAEVLP